MSLNPLPLAFSEFLAGLTRSTVTPVLHIPDFFAPAISSEAEDFFQTLPLEPLIHDGIVARHEAAVAGGETRASTGLAAVIKHVAGRIGYRDSHSIEHCAFAYAPGQSVPEHQDTPRHALVAMGYFGKFEGGRYAYRDPSDQDIQLDLSAGDLLVCVNSLGTGVALRPMHRVDPITSGRRLVLAASYVRSD